VSTRGDASTVKVFDFQASLKKGQKAESEFYELFKDKVDRLDGYISDFKIIKNGKTIELKTDFHDPSKTLNFFMEKYSYDDKAGGPYQALEKKSDYFVFFFPSTMEFFCYKVKALVKWLDKYYDNPYLLNVYNKGHVTKGFLVKRAELEDIRIQLEDIL
jgi:hypothetical protein